MHDLHSRIRLFGAGGLLTLLGLSLSACATTESWKEQVLLHDGHTIVVTRTMERAPANSLGHGGPLSETLTFTPPGLDRPITWKTRFNESPGKPGSLNPMLLDIVRGTVYLVATPVGCISYNKWRRPNPPYIALKYISGHWTRIPVKALPTVLVHANLIDPPSPDKVEDFYTLKDVKEQLQDALLETRTVFRTPIRTNWVMCPVLVPITSGASKGGWTTPGALQSIESIHHSHR
jgi:hypothetical protein